MKASIVDLRYKTRDILKTLDRNETVTVLYHGKVKEHPFFGMNSNNEEAKDVLEKLEDLRQSRYDF